MKYLLLSLLLGGAAIAVAQAQELTSFRDSVDHFTIGVPKGWKYQSAPGSKSVCFAAYLPVAPEGTKVRTNYNINVITGKRNSSIGREYRRLMNALLSAGDMTVTGRDSITIHGQAWLTFTDTHPNMVAGQNISMGEYVLVTYKEETTYIITFGTSAERLAKDIVLFRQIAATVVVDPPVAGLRNG
jgi:hypothetical protein